MALSWKDEVIKARVRLRDLQPRFWYILMYLEPVETADTDFGWATDGLRLFYNPARLEQDEKQGIRWREYIDWVLCHEAWHCAAEHMGRRGKRDAIALYEVPPSEAGKPGVIEQDGKFYRGVPLWNIAIDMETNHLLSEAGLRCPVDKLGNYLGVEGAPGIAEAHYDRLLAEMPIITAGSAPFDGHMDSDQDIAGDGPGGKAAKPLDEMGREDSQGRGQGRVDWKKVMAEADAFEKQVRKSQGHEPGCFEEAIEAARQSRVNWKQYITREMSALAKTRFRFERPNRRYIHQGMYLPGPVKDDPRVVFVIDSSGSMGTEALSQGLAELYAMSQMLRTELTILVVDAEVQYVCKKPADVKMRGRGGTDFRPAFDYVERERINPALLVYFTDGWGDFPDRPPQYKVIWAMTTDEKPPFGKVVRVPLSE
jgi:predicted metal-dependent peptidase